jgi:hypothetical protein
VSTRESAEQFPYRPSFVFDSVGHIDLDVITAQV